MYNTAHVMDYLTWQKLADQRNDQCAPSPVVSDAELAALDLDQQHIAEAQRLASAEIDRQYPAARAHLKRLVDIWLGLAPGTMTPAMHTMRMSIARQLSAAERAAETRHYAALRRTVALTVVEQPRDVAA